MRHRWTIPTVTAALALLLPLSGGSRARADDDGPTSKSFDDKNFSMTVPKGWAVEDPSEEDKASGYVCVARRPVSPSVYASAWFLVKSAGTTTLDGYFDELKKIKLAKLEDHDVQGPDTVTFGGTADAKYMRVVGKSGGSKVVSKVFAAIVAGRYHQLEFRAFNGADDQVSEEIDAIVAGYKFLKGATAAAPKPKGGTAPGSSDPAGSSGPAPGAGDGPGKPSADGLSMRFDKYKLTWSLPKPPKEGDPAFWTFASVVEERSSKSGGGGLLGIDDKETLAVVVRTGSDDAPLRILLRAGPAKAGFLPSAVVSDDDNYQNLAHDSFEGTPVPNVDQDISLGNWRGASRSYTGKGRDGKGYYFRSILAVLKGVAYDLQVTAENGGEMKHLDDVKRALSGFAWDDVNEGIRGPWAAPFGSVTAERKEWLDFGKETSVKKGVVSLKKPAAFGTLRFTTSDEGFGSWVFACESRKQGAYCFIGIQSFSYAFMQHEIPPREPDSLIDEFESTWKNAVTEPKTLTQKSGKANKQGASMAGAKGSTYQFEGIADGKPFVEHGWVVRADKNVIWIRAQFGGKDAETILGADWKKLQATIKIE